MFPHILQTPPQRIAEQAGHSPSTLEAGQGLSATLEAYSSRRSHAFDVAEEAYWGRKISAEDYMLFRLLVRLCKDRIYCWPGLDYLAQRIGASVGTIKRRLESLERAELIERRQRAGGLTAHTYVLPLKAYDRGMRVEAEDTHVSQLGSATGDALAEPDAASCTSEKIGPTGPADVGQSNPMLFFVPDEGITGEPADRSGTISHTIKSQKLKQGGGRSAQQHLEQLPPTASMNTLSDAGVLSPTVLYELRDVPVDDVQACLRFARRQRNIVDPTGFAVSLLRLGFGQKLAGQHMQHGPGAENDEAGLAYYHCRHGCIRGGGCSDCEAERAVIPRPAYGQARGAPHNKVSHEVVAGGPRAEVMAVWSEVLEELQRELPAVDFETWLAGTAPLLLDDELMVLGTPHVFVRDQILTHYKSRIENALATANRRPLRLEVVIGGG